jgi:hypothetical protein
LRFLYISASGARVERVRYRQLAECQGVIESERRTQQD